MRHCYPTPQDVGIRTPVHLVKNRFRSGFDHALRGGQITEVKQLRLSFREGYRAGKLYLRDLRKAQGIISFPLQGRVKFRVIH